MPDEFGQFPLVFAPSYRIAQMVARGMGLKPGRWRYVTDVRDIRGVSTDVQIYVYDSYRRYLSDRQFLTLCETRLLGMNNVRDVHEDELIP